MILQYYTILKIINQLKKLIGFEIIECFTQKKDSAFININDSKDEYFIEISTSIKYSNINIRKHFKRANSNTLDIFKEIKNEFIQNIESINNDRIVKISLIKFDLFIFLFGRGKSNLFLCNKKMKIIDSLEDKVTFQNTILTIPQNKIFEYDNLFAKIEKHPHYLGKYYLKEFKKVLENKNITEENQINLELEKFKNNILNHDKYYLYKNEIGEFLFSLIGLSQLEEYFSSNDIFLLIRKKVSLSIEKEEFKILFSPVNLKLQKYLKSANSKVEALNRIEELRKTIDKYHNFGSILQSQMNSKEKFGNKIELNDWEGNIHLIELDARMNLIENANKYFEKAKKIEKDIKLKQKNQDKVIEEAKILNELNNELNSINEIKSLKKFISENSKLLGIKMENDKNDSTKFREFKIDGWDFYVGKNAENNDELTLKFAKSNDLWFHARGVGGSHCLLKTNNKTNIPKDVIKKAAGISAYYSQARNGKYVPVIFTQKKYIRKPKGANPGSVILQKEEVIMTEPINPSELFV